MPFFSSKKPPGKVVVTHMAVDVTLFKFWSMIYVSSEINYERNSQIRQQAII